MERLNFQAGEKDQGAVALMYKRCSKDASTEGSVSVLEEMGCLEPGLALL